MARVEVIEDDDDEEERREVKSHEKNPSLFRPYSNIS